jgi:probable F420-dependent oxidoreductase
MRFTFHYPECSGPEGDLLAPGPPAEIAAAAERCGFSGISFSEHPAPGARWLASGGHQTFDPFIALAHVAAVTSRIRLITNVSVAPYRNPLLLAKAAASLDLLSGGRLTLGLGTGYIKGEFFALGVGFDERNALFDEALDVLPLHWCGEPFSYEGRHFSARDIMARPRPVQNPIPIWVGGNSALTRRRVAQRAQGWMPLTGDATLTTTSRTPALGSVPELAERIRQIRDAAAAAGRPDPIDVQFSYQGLGIRTPGADADRHREAFAELAEAGVTWIVVSSGATDRQATLDFLEGFATAYL